MSYHTTAPEIFDTIILSLVLVPTKKHIRPLDLILTLGAVEFQELGFLSNHPKKVVSFYIFTTPKSKSYMHF
jgi:hypothetical protein